MTGEDAGKSLTMPDAQPSMEGLVTDLIDAADRFDPEAPGWLYSGYIDSSTAEWAHDARDELVALQPKSTALPLVDLGIGYLILKEWRPTAG